MKHNEGNDETSAHEMRQWRHTYLGASVVFNDPEEDKQKQMTNVVNFSTNTLVDSTWVIYGRNIVGRPLTIVPRTEVCNSDCKFIFRYKDLS